MEDGTSLDLYIEREASEMANYDGWGTHNNRRVNVHGNVTAGETITVQIVGFNGGSYSAKAPDAYTKSRSKKKGRKKKTKKIKEKKQRSTKDGDIRGSKNDLLNSDL